MRIVSVNGQDMTHATKPECLTAIKAQPYTVIFGMTSVNAAAAADPAAPAAAAAAESSQRFDDWGKLKLIKYLREKNIDYKGATGVDGLRQLAQANA